MNAALASLLLSLIALNAKADGNRCWQTVGDVPTSRQTFTYQKGHEAQKLYVFKPMNRKPPYKTIMMVHGGCFQWGNAISDDSLLEIQRFVNAGYAVVSPNYRRSDSNHKMYPFPTALNDVEDALRYIRAQGKQMADLDTRRVCGMGYSAGATLLLYMNNERIHGSDRRLDTASPNDPELSKPLDCVIDLSGRTNFTSGTVRLASADDDHVNLAALAPPIDCAERFLEEPRTKKDMKDFEKASPLRHITKDSGDVLAIHGTADTLVSFSNAQELCERYKTVINKAYSGNPVLAQKLIAKKCKLVKVPGAQHVCLNKDLKTMDIDNCLDPAWMSICSWLARDENFPPSRTTDGWNTQSLKQSTGVSP